MATFDKLEESGEIIRVFVPLPRGAVNRRKFYVLPELLTWMINDLPKLEPGRLKATEDQSSN
jgi:hypothetical protein